jgi:hypothetical protein
VSTDRRCVGAHRVRFGCIFIDQSTRLTELFAVQIRMQLQASHHIEPNQTKSFST